jgi:hypothetical protein
MPMEEEACCCLPGREGSVRSVPHQHVEFLAAAMALVCVLRSTWCDEHPPTKRFEENKKEHRFVICLREVLTTKNERSGKGDKSN